MPTLLHLAHQYLAFEPTDISAFQRECRILQSMWREEKGYEAGFFAGKDRGNYLPMPWAKETLNNYLSETIKEVVRREVVNCPNNGKLFASPRIFNNLLSSQPLCFNLFAELQQDLPLATKVFHLLCPSRIDVVTAIEFEHSPSRGDPKYTGDSSAFDVYVEYVNRSGERGFIGIEVKYHENLLTKPSTIKPRYFQIAEMMKCFKSECLEILQLSPLEQIWRDHLLAGSLLNAGDGYKDGFFVFLAPKDNPHCSAAVGKYRACLTEDQRTFENWKLEDVVAVIKENTGERWIDEVSERYLGFGKIETQMDQPVSASERRTS
jgi:hypothetical protein